MLKLADIAQDTKAEAEGVWRISPWGGEFLIARAGNREYRREVKRLVEARREKLRGADLSDDDWADVNRDASAKCVLLGWRDIEGADGKPLAYSAKAARALLTDEQFGDLAEWIAQTATNAESYRLKARKDAEGN